MDTYKFKESVDNGKRKVGLWLERTGEKIKVFYSNHREEIITLGPAAIAGTGWIIKTVHQNHKIKRVENLKDEYIYDRSGGHYWKLRRKPTTSEWVAIENRRKNGEKYSDILTSMRLL